MQVKIFKAIFEIHPLKNTILETNLELDVTARSELVYVKFLQIWNFDHYLLNTSNEEQNPRLN